MIPLIFHINFVLFTPSSISLYCSPSTFPSKDHLALGFSALPLHISYELLVLSLELLSLISNESSAAFLVFAFIPGSRLIRLKSQCYRKHMREIVKCLSLWVWVMSLNAAFSSST